MNLKLLLSSLTVSTVSLTAQNLTIDDFGSGSFVINAISAGYYSATRTGPSDSIVGGTSFFETDVGDRAIAIASPGIGIFSYTDTRRHADTPPPQSTFSFSYGSAGSPLNLDLSSATALSIQVEEVLISGNPINQAGFGYSWIISSGASEVSLSPTTFSEFQTDLLFPLADFSAAPGFDPADFSTIESIVLQVSCPDVFEENPIIPPASSRLRLNGLTAILPAPEPVPEACCNNIAMLTAFGLFGLVSMRRRADRSRPTS